MAPIRFGSFSGFVLGRVGAALGVIRAASATTLVRDDAGTATLTSASAPTPILTRNEDGSVAVTAS